MSAGDGQGRRNRVVSDTAGTSRVGVLRRVVPADWPFAVRAGVESVLAGWLLVVVPTLAVFAATSSMDAAAALSVGTALRTGTGLWSLGLGGAWGSASSPDGVVGLPLLGLTIIQALITRWSVRRSRLVRLMSGLWAVLSAMAGAALIAVASGPAGSRTWTAVLGLGALTALITFGHLQRAGRGWEVATRWWARRPRWTDPALALVRSTVLAIAALVAVVVVAAVVTGAGRVGRLHDALSAGGIVASLGLVALQAGWAPTMLVWALAWLAGPGFTVGTGSLFSPDVVIPDAVPAMPVLGLLPTAPLGTAGVYLPMVITLAAMGAAWHRRRVLLELELSEALMSALAATLIVTLGCLALALGASGPIGPDRMTRVGPHTGYLCLFIALEVGVGLIAIAVLTHPTTHDRLTARRAPGASRAADPSARSTRESRRTAAEARRERSSAPEARRVRDDGGGSTDSTDGTDSTGGDDGIDAADGTGGETRTEGPGRRAPTGVGARRRTRTGAALRREARSGQAPPRAGAGRARRETARGEAEPAAMTGKMTGRVSASMSSPGSGRGLFAGWREQAQAADSASEQED